MRRFVSILAVSVALLQLGCATSGEIKYTGANAPADEPSWIKDPEATAVTRDGGNRSDTTRTDSNRVDIPVYEFAQLRCHYTGGARTARQGLDARYSGEQFDATRVIDAFDTRKTEAWLNSRQMNEQLNLRVNRTLFRGMEAEEELYRRYGRDRITAYSADATTWYERGPDKTRAFMSKEQVEAVRAQDELEAARTREGFFHASGERVIGLHLFKYANRELVGDGVEITYTLIYHNTNEYDTGPTEIDEPVPYYTTYLTGSATLPKERTSVNFIARPGNRDLLRWSFAQGIKAGETGQMTYKVKVLLDAPYDQRPPEDQPKAGR